MVNIADDERLALFGRYICGHPILGRRHMAHSSFARDLLVVSVFECLVCYIFRSNGVFLRLLDGSRPGLRAQASQPESAAHGD